MKLLTLITIAVLITSVGFTNLQAQQKTVMKKPFLIQGELPHLTENVKMLWNDDDLALTKEQKERLLVVRKDTLSRAKSLAKIINPLEAKIVKASNSHATPDSLKKSVTHLANLRAEATMIHLSCIYKTRNILTPEQLEIVE